MAKIALIARLGVEDKGVVVDGKDYQKIANLDFLRTRKSNEVKLDQFFKELKKLKLQPSEVAMDLLIIACTMYGADTRIDRSQVADDSWTREIDLFIPVSNVDIWNNEKESLKQIFRFLTGDIWDIVFRERTNLNMISPNSKLKKYKMPYITDTVCLFSGGMDSFIGAINLLSSGVQPLLLGHAKSADVSPNQKFCEESLKTAFPLLPFKRIYAFLRIPKTNLFEMEEKTERGRSFLFLTLGGITASCLSDKSKLIVPENGLISLNIPLTPMRIGSHSTRTTHPYYMSLMQTLFDKLNMGVKLENPYQFKTKGEMLSECLNNKIVESTNTMSCSHPSGRFEKKGNAHCGYCVPCIIRRASYKHAGVFDNSDYRHNILDQQALSSDAKRDNIIAFNYLLEKISNNRNYLKTLIRSTGPLGSNVDEYVNVYLRGITEVKALLSKVKL